MNDQTIKSIVDEIATVLVGNRIGKVFQLSRLTIAIDFRTRDSRYLLLSVDPRTGPSLYLIVRRVRDLEKQSLKPGSFVATFHKRLAGAHLVAIQKEEGDRIVRFSFKARDISGKSQEYTLIAQLTGRTANIHLIDDNGYVIDSLRWFRGDVMEGATKYKPPPSDNIHSSTEPSLKQDSFDSLSEAADFYYQALQHEQEFTSHVSSARARLKKESTHLLKLRRHLENDLQTHGDAETHKRIGELLLANVGTAERHGEIVKVTDYYTEGMPTLELQIDENTTLQEEGARRFKRYAKARRAAEEIALRLVDIENGLLALRVQEDHLEDIIAEHNLSALDNFFDDKNRSQRQSSGKKGLSRKISGARRYLSSDGFEILVGRAAKDNDHLTFKIARPHDLWLHAANYSGSHVIVLNPTRKEIPHRTVIEAAQLAAKFSQAHSDGKVDVHYTQRKFLAKPKGASPGLVRMSSFRTIIVEPRHSVERI